MGMLESGPIMCKDAVVDCAMEEKWSNSGMRMNRLMYNLDLGGNNGSSVAVLQGDLTGANSLLTEPKAEKFFEDDVMYLKSESADRCLLLDEFPWNTDYYNRDEDYGIVDADAAQTGKEESKYEFVDSILQGVDDERSLHLPCSLSSPSHDYLLDSSYGGCSQFGYISCNKSEGLGSEFQTQCTERDGNAGAISELSCVIKPLAESSSDCTSFLDSKDAFELPDKFRSTFGRDTWVQDEEWLKRHILFGLQNFTELDSASVLVEDGLLSNENEDNMILIPGNNLCERVYSFLTDAPDRRTSSVSRAVGKDVSDENPQMATSAAASGRCRLLNSGETEHAHITSKRLRKPTRRYIEEASETKSRHCNERLKPYNSRNKFLHHRTNRQCYWKEDIPLVYQECAAISGIQVPGSLHVRRGRPRKNTSLVGNCKKEHKMHSVSPKTIASWQFESESLDDMSDDCATETLNEKTGIRRKHHRQWSLSEVVKLVDGVSQYGVGRWTEIKRLLFSTSAYRTSVDLKDKWRNLLRASMAELQNRNQVLAQKKNASLPIPQTVLRRVRELSVIHPYPRERKLRVPSVVVTPADITSDDKSISCFGRAVQKRSFT